MRLTRRNALCAIAAATLGSQLRAAPAAPRLACLEWTAAEMAISLGFAPIAVGDPTAYANWAVTPALPEGVADLGPRSAPNLELLAELKPDLAIGASGYGYEGLDIARFAPLHTLELLGRPESSPYEIATSEQLRLADRLGVRDRAAASIAAYEADIAAAARSLAGRRAEPLLVVSIFEDRHVRIYGRGGLFHETLGRMSLKNAWSRDVGRWGFAYAKLEDLFAAPANARLVTLDPIPAHIRIRLARSALWNNLPFVREGRVTSIGPTWPFGGLAAAARFASELARRLPAA